MANITPECREKLVASALSLVNSLTHAIVHGTYRGVMISRNDMEEGVEGISQERYLAEPLEAAGIVVDYDALYFSKASQANRKRMLKDDPTIASRQIFTFPTTPETTPAPVTS